MNFHIKCLILLFNKFNFLLLNKMILSQFNNNVYKIKTILLFYKVFNLIIIKKFKHQMTQKYIYYINKIIFCNYKIYQIKII